MLEGDAGPEEPRRKVSRSGSLPQPRNERQAMCWKATQAPRSQEEWFHDSAPCHNRGTKGRQYVRRRSRPRGAKRNGFTIRLLATTEERKAGNMLEGEAGPDEPRGMVSRFGSLPQPRNERQAICWKATQAPRSQEEWFHDSAPCHNRRTKGRQCAGRRRRPRGAKRNGFTIRLLATTEEQKAGNMLEGEAGPEQPRGMVSRFGSLPQPRNESQAICWKATQAPRSLEEWFHVSAPCHNRRTKGRQCAGRRRRPRGAKRNGFTIRLLATTEEQKAGNMLEGEAGPEEPRGMVSRFGSLPQPRNERQAKC